MLKMSLIPSGVAALGALAGSPSHFSVHVIWTCSPGLWTPSVAGVSGVAGLAGVVLSWMSWTWAGGHTWKEADFDYETRGRGTSDRYEARWNHMVRWKVERTTVEVEMQGYRKRSHRTTVCERRGREREL